MTRSDVAVVGLGAMGSSAAWQLARRGRRVVAFEQYGRDHSLGGSHGRSRIFRLAYEQDDYVRLALESLRAWREIEAAAGVEILVQNGAVDFGNAAVVGRIGAALQRHGVEAAMLTAAQAHQRWPGLRFTGSVLHSPDGGRTDADVARFALQDLAAGAGADLRFDTRVHAVDVRAGRAVLDCDGGTVEAGTVVVTANAWTPHLLRDVLAVPPLHVTQEQPAFFTAHDPTAEWPSFIHYVGDGQQASDFAAYGLPSPLEGGVKVGEHGTGIPIDPHGERPPPDPERVARLSAYVAEHLPGLDPGPIEVSRCLYDMTADEDFLVDRAGPIVVGAGFSGHGFKFVPAVGRLLADLADGMPHGIRRFRFHRR